MQFEPSCRRSNSCKYSGELTATNPLRVYTYMTDNSNNIIIGEKPILQFGLYYNETDDLTKTYLVADNDDEEVEPSPLNPKEKALLAKYEKDIDEELEGFVLVGQRLSQIKAQKLFRGSHRSFHQYCQDRFGFGRSYAKRVIEASKCVENLKSVPIGTVSIPGNESQARPLINLSPKDQVKVAKQTKENIGNREPTTRDFEKAKAQVMPGKTAKKTSKAKAEATKDEAQELSKVIPLPSNPAPSPAIGSFVVPADFHKGIDLPTLKELSETATTLKYIGWDSKRQAEREKLLLTLTAWLPLYAEWEQAVLGSVKQQEAA